MSKLKPKQVEALVWLGKQIKSKDFILGGSAALMMHGLRKKAKDLDIMVKNFSVIPKSMENYEIDTDEYGGYYTNEFEEAPYPVLRQFKYKGIKIDVFMNPMLLRRYSDKWLPSTVSRNTDVKVRFCYPEHVLDAKEYYARVQTGKAKRKHTKDIVKIKEYLETLRDRPQDRVNITMPFGKYKGKLLAEVSCNYWEWLIYKSNIDLKNHVLAYSFEVVKKDFI